MELIIGGAYQGKTVYVKSRYGLGESETFVCSPDRAEIDFSRPCVDRLEEFVWACVREDVDAAGYLRASRDKWKDTVFVCRDIFCGVVPVDKTERAWREAAGRAAAYLASEAAHVTRLFCGLPQTLK